MVGRYVYINIYTPPTLQTLQPLQPHTQTTQQETTIIWAHWLIRTYTLGALDTRKIALMARLETLLDHTPPNSALPDLLQVCIFFSRFSFFSSG